MYRLQEVQYQYSDPSNLNVKCVSYNENNGHIRIFKEENSDNSSINNSIKQEKSNSNNDNNKNDNGNENRNRFVLEEEHSLSRSLAWIRETIQEVFQSSEAVTNEQLRATRNIAVRQAIRRVTEGNNNQRDNAADPFRNVTNVRRRGTRRRNNNLGQDHPIEEMRRSAVNNNENRANNNDDDDQNAPDPEEQQHLDTLRNSINQYRNYLERRSRETANSRSGQGAAEVDNDSESTRTETETESSSESRYASANSVFDGQYPGSRSNNSDSRTYSLFNGMEPESSTSSEESDSQSSDVLAENLVNEPNFQSSDDADNNYTRNTNDYSWDNENRRDMNSRRRSMPENSMTYKITTTKMSKIKKKYKLNAIDLPEPRSGHQCFTDGKYLYVIGGYAEDDKLDGVFDLDETQTETIRIKKNDTVHHLYNEIWRMDLKTDIWERLPGDVPIKPASGSITSIMPLFSKDQKIYNSNTFIYIGGTGFPFHMASKKIVAIEFPKLSTLSNPSPETNSFFNYRYSTIANLPEKLYLHSTCFDKFNFDLYIYGGIHVLEDTENDFDSRFYKFNLKTKELTELHPDYNCVLPEWSLKPCMHVYNDKIYMLCNPGSRKYTEHFTRIYVYEISKNLWSQEIIKGDRYHSKYLPYLQHFSEFMDKNKIKIEDRYLPIRFEKFYKKLHEPENFKKYIENSITKNATERDYEMINGFGGNPFASERFQQHFKTLTSLKPDFIDKANFELNTSRWSEYLKSQRTQGRYAFQERNTYMERGEIIEDYCWPLNRQRMAYSIYKERYLIMSGGELIAHEGHRIMQASFGPIKMLSDIWSLDLETLEWQYLGHLDRGLSFHGQAVTDQGLLLVFGGKVGVSQLGAREAQMSRTSTPRSNCTWKMQLGVPRLSSLCRNVIKQESETRPYF